MAGESEEICRRVKGRNERLGRADGWTEEWGGKQRKKPGRRSGGEGGGGGHNPPHGAMLE